MKLDIKKCFFIIILLIFVIGNFIFRQEDEVITKEKITIDIKGAVLNPGVYKLDEGSLLTDLIHTSGGFKDANELCYNLAEPLINGSAIVIKNSNSPCFDKEQKVNLNLANKNLLMSLPGIGEKKADDIINLRNIKPFRTIHEIKNIRGIGEKTFLKLQNLISI